MTDPRRPEFADDAFEAAASAFFDDVDLFDEPDRVVPLPLDPEPVVPEPVDAAPNASTSSEDEADAAPLPPDLSFDAVDADPAPEPAPVPEPVDTAPDPEPLQATVDVGDLPILDETPPAYSPSIWREQQEFKRHRVRRLLIGVAAAWVVAMLAMVSFGILSLQNARAQLNGVEEELSLSKLDNADTPGAQATADSMARAHTMFSSPVIAPLKLVPVVGRQLRTLDALSQSGATVIRAGIEARHQARPLATRPPRNGAERLEALATARTIARDALAKLETVDLGPSKNLIGPLGSTRAKFAAELNRIGELLQRTETGAAGLATFFKGPSRYAVFAANNAEMRAGSGMYLSAGTLDVANGELRLGPMKSIYDLPPAPTNVALEYDYLRLWGLQAPGSDYRFVNMTPRFPTSAALAQRMWAASGAPPVDGVLVIDPVAAVELLKLVGHVKVGDTTVTPANGLRLFLHDQYLTYNAKPTAKATVERRDFLTDTVQEIFARLNSGAFEPAALGNALADAAAGRHLMAWTPTAPVQRAWNALHMDGTLPDDAVLFALQNRGGNKLDWFQTVSAVANATLTPKGSTIEMRFLVTNTTPAGEPQYVAGPVGGSHIKTAGVYSGIASINLPAAATNVKLRGGLAPMADGPDGNTQVVSRYFELEPGESETFTLSFALPPGVRALTVMPSARVPTVFWHLDKTSWHDEKPQVITW